MSKAIFDEERKSCKADGKHYFVTNEITDTCAIKVISGKKSENNEYSFFTNAVLSGDVLSVYDDKNRECLFSYSYFKDGRLLFLKTVEDSITDPLIWSNMSDEEKIYEIFRLSQENKETVRQKITLKTKEILEYERSREVGIVCALLLFLIAGYSNQPRKKDYTREAHSRLCRSIADVFRTQDHKSIEMLKVILPACTAEGYYKYCDLYLADYYKENAHLTCSCYNRSSWPKCMSAEKVHDRNGYQKMTDQHVSSLKNHVEKMDLRGYLRNVNFDIRLICDFDSKYLDSDAYPYRIASFVIRMMNIWPYLDCKKCQKPLFPDLQYATVSEVYTMVNFVCEQCGEKVYLNHCYRCAGELKKRFVIDSRECIRTEDDVCLKKKKNKNMKPMYLCMRCGGTQYVMPNRYCPVCGIKLPPGNYNFMIKCGNCGHDGSIYGEKPVSEDIRKLFAKYRNIPVQLKENEYFDYSLYFTPQRKLHESDDELPY